MKIKKLRNILFKHLPTLLRVETMRRFPSTYESLKIRPTSAWINVTDNCNMKCIMCNQWETTKKGEMTTDEWKNAMSQLAEMGVKELCFGGGEPLLVRDLNLLIKHGRDLGMDVGITTSGFLLTQAKLDELLEAGMSNVTVSIDGIEEGYEKIRRRDWKNVLRGVEVLAKANKEKGLPVIIGFVLMKPTLNNYAGVQALAKKHGLPIVTSLVDTTPFLFQLPENKNENWIGPSSTPELNKIQNQMVEYKNEDTSNIYNSFYDIDFFESYFKEPLQSKTPCTVSQVRVMINGMGDIYGGCWSMGTFGSLREKSLKEIIHSEKYQSTHKKMFYKDCPGCSCGYSTSNRYYLPAQIKETLFRIFPWSKKRKVATNGIAPVAINGKSNKTPANIPIQEEKVDKEPLSKV